MTSAVPTIAILPPSISIEPIATAVAAPPEDKRVQRYKLLKDFYKFLDATTIFRRILALEQELKELYQKEGFEITSRDRNVVQIRPIDKNVDTGGGSVCITMLSLCDICCTEIFRKEPATAETSKILDQIAPLEKELYEKVYQDRKSFFDDLQKFCPMRNRENAITVPIIEALFDIEVDQLTTLDSSKQRMSPDPIFTLFNKKLIRKYNYDERFFYTKDLVIQGFKSDLNSTPIQLHIDYHSDEGEVYDSLRPTQRITKFTLFDKIDVGIGPRSSYVSLPNLNFFYGFLFEAKRRQNQKEREIETIMQVAITEVGEVNRMILSYISVAIHDFPTNMTTIVTSNANEASFHPDHFVNPPKGSGHLDFDHYVHYNPLD